MKRILLPIVFLLSVAATCFGDISRCVDATCRVSSGNAKGTGVVIAVTPERVLVLTNAHVAATARPSCEFWTHGHQSLPVKSTTILRNQDTDVAVLSIPSGAFGTRIPPAVPIARTGTVAKGTTLVSVGCAKGAWATSWKGHSLGYASGTLRFLPVPADGRSGSALFDVDGTQVVGLIRARTPDERQGIAVPASVVLACLKRAVAHSTIAAHGILTQACPDCPDGGCQLPIIGDIFPYRRGQERYDGQQDDRIDRLEDIYPTLPRQHPGTPPARPMVKVDMQPVVDAVNSVGEKLDGFAPAFERLDGKLDVIIDQTKGSILPPLEDVPPPDPEPDPVVVEAIEDTNEQVGALATILKTALGDQETLRERMEARLAKVEEEAGPDASAVDIMKAYAKDYAGEKGGEIGWSAGQLVGARAGIEGVGALAICVVMWIIGRQIGDRIKTGDPLLTERLYARWFGGESQPAAPAQAPVIVVPPAAQAAAQPQPTVIVQQPAAAPPQPAAETPAPKATA